MKLSTKRQGLQGLLAGFFLVGFLLLTGTRAEAQDLNNWLQSDQAKTALELEIKAIHGELPNLAGAQLNDAKAHVYYYKTIFQRVNDGEEVALAVPTSLSIFSDTASPIDVTVNQGQKDQLYADAVSLLAL